MAAKTDIQVLLGGKIYTLSGYESEDYLQKIASYVNGKIAELNNMPNYKRMNADMQKTLLELNMADDYYKAKQQIEILEADLEEKDRIEYDLKHELINTQMQLEDAAKNAESLKKEISDLKMQVVKLESKYNR